MSAHLEHFLATVGEIPVTPVPVIDVRQQGVLISAANNASIGYRANDGPRRPPS
jgi:hypothetical protein